jgi:hypothetical protein
MPASCNRDVPRRAIPAIMSSRDDEFTEYISERMMSLRRTAFMLCQDWHRADDLVQAAITRLYVHWGRARAADHIDACARTVLVREFLGERRSAWARRVSLDGQVPPADAGDSWAIVAGGGKNGPPGTIVKVAAGTLFRAPVPTLMFPIQLTGLPAAWRVGSVHFVAYDMRGTQLNLAGTGTRGLPPPSADATLAGPGSSCFFYPGGQSQRRTINGIAVIVTRTPGHGHVPAAYNVCAAHARGLFVSLSTYGSKRPRAVSIFTHNLRILGSDPARWTTQPLS